MNRGRGEPEGPPSTAFLHSDPGDPSPPGTPGWEPGRSGTDVAVIGAGFGGLATALRLAESGARVVVCEALTYPGGCASTFARSGHTFEAGATLASGFGPGQLFRGWIDRHRLDVELAPLDPVVEFRAPGLCVPVAARRDTFIETFLALPDAPRDGIRRFFAEQGRVADVLWGVLDTPALLPPFTPRALLEHVRRLPSYAPLVPLLGRPLAAVLARHGVERFAPLRLYADAVSRITVQAGVDDAEALFALATMDYFFRGTGHVRGGIGRLADGLVAAIRGTGGAVLFANRVRGIRRAPRGWIVETRGGSLAATTVVANVLPADLASLLDRPVEATRVLRDLDADVATGWGAAMIYRVLLDEGGDARHLQLVGDPSRPLVEGNHVFCSLGDARPGPDGRLVRSLTASTHVPLGELLVLDEAAQAERIDAIHDRMRAVLAARAPEWEERRIFEMTASPRTFERFTRRHRGFVGGVPRRRGLRNYRRLGPVEVERDLFLVGDSVFPGQSTLAAAIGGIRLAELILRRAGTPAPGGVSLVS